MAADLKKMACAQRDLGRPFDFSTFDLGVTSRDLSITLTVFQKIWRKWTLGQKKNTCVSGQRARQFQPCASTFFFFQFNSFATLPVFCLGLLNVQLQLVVHEQCTRLKNTKY